MLQKLKLVLVTLLLSMSFTYAQTGRGTIKGSVIDKENGEAMPFVKVVVYQNGTQKGYAATDFTGKFIISALEPGKYDVEVKFVGYNSIKETGVVVNSDKYTIRNYEMSTSSEMLDEVEIIIYEVPLIDKDGGASGGTVTRDDISKMAARSATGVAKTVGGVYSPEGGGEGVSIRGTRSDATYYYIDGIKVRGSSNLPKSAIQEVSVITGGVPANYGDITGGIISITTRGPSSRYFGSVEYVTSGYYFNGKDPLGYDGRVFGLDKYAYNLFEGMISGPLLMKKDSTGEKTDKPILGFFLSANFTDVIDARPLANGGAYRIKKEVRDDILNDSTGSGVLRPTGAGSGSFYNTSFLDSSAFEQVKWRMNTRSRSYSAAGKIDVNVGPSMNLTFGGSMNYRNSNIYSYSNSLMNFDNFGTSTGYDWRVYGKFTQRFSNNDEGSTSKIKSAYYSIMIDYSQSHSKFEDERHKDKIFNYGYVGRFDITTVPTYTLSSGGDSLLLDGFKDVLVEFTPSETNRSLAAQTSQYYALNANDPVGNYENLFQIQAGGGLRNGDIPASVYGLWANMGTPYNGYGYSQADQFRVTGSGTINLNDHAITLGFEFEQRWDRVFSSDRIRPINTGPISIWTLGRQLMNAHILEIDKSNYTSDFYGTLPRITYSRLNASPGDYTGQEGNDNQTFFDYSVRKKIGEERGYTGADLDNFIDGTEFINIDALDPNFFDLSMFSADELLNSGQSYFTWRGYDSQGNKIKGTTDINKYFNEFDANGNYSRNIGAFQPIYMAGYVMDKFAFDDIIFNVGLRVDMFDANQPVLKDPYLVYEAKTAKEITELPNGTAIVHPDNIGDDYVVYVNDKDNITSITGYRNGDVWYDANGVEVADSKLVEGSKGIAPWLVDPALSTPNEKAFEDYKAQINFMPRIAFSFPISDEAAFFAHYDILTKRPTTGNIFDPTDYQFMQNRSNPILNNPNLRPEKTIDYEIGFQQVLTKTSSIKISAFYKEQRDQVQLMGVFGAYPNTYLTYGNRDFGTIKGTTISYDMRRTGNLRMTASYTLQFASGTGSDANSAFSFINAGVPNLRNIFPYDFDQRHNINIVLDYRYGGGKDYNGPKIKDFGVFENTGINVTTNLGSGTPYSRQQIVSAEALGTTTGLLGNNNGSRKPWTYRVDMQIDRNFDLKFGGDDDNKKKLAYLNVYLRVTNVFNIINTLNVYRFTGNPTDDGFLMSAQGETFINQQINAASFINYYTMNVQNPFNLGIPRTVRLGLLFNF
ncbi:MAG TPA: TonB-dependent receptor [Crocinitomix sp.]|nr:TonB-dependent receptor [Crocinitomix sp.]